ncbi:MAG: hypothetical protein Q9191_003785 [Dirinaria sp. TL-2023a]
MDVVNVRPKSMARRISVGLPTHLKLESSNYGFQPASKPTYATSSEGVKRRHWITASEVVSSTLISLPFILLAVTKNLHGAAQVSEGALGNGPLEKQAQQEVTGSKLPLAVGLDALSTCFLTSGILLLVGATVKVPGLLSGATGERQGASGHRQTGGAQTGMLTVAGFQKIVTRCLKVGLPFYACLKLGDVRTVSTLVTAMVTDLTASDENPQGSNRSLKTLLRSRRWTVTILTLQFLSDLIGLTNSTGVAGILTGYLALSVSVFALPLPFPIHTSRKPHISSPVEPPPPTGSNTLATLKEVPTTSNTTLTPERALSSLVYTPEDVDFTLSAGVLAAGISLVLFFLFAIPNSGIVSGYQIGGGLLTTFAAVLSMTFTQPQSLRQSRGVGLVLGSSFACLSSAVLTPGSWTMLSFQCVSISIYFAATVKDTQSSASSSRHNHTQHHHTSEHSHHDELSAFSRYLLDCSGKWPLLHSILLEKDSRRIFYFMILNFAFMLVQTFYGIATGSLGLLSDSIHMFFDCLALVVGLCAAVMSKWPPSTRFPYGFGKVDTLAGFANGIFLMLISIEIVYEAAERLVEGSEMQRLSELLTVSGLGLVVNLVGITAFGHAHHGHGHSHGGHDHGHAHPGHAHADHSHTHCEHSTNSHISHNHGPNPIHHHHHHHHHEHDHHEHEHEHAHLHDHLNCPTPSPYSSIPATPSKPMHPHSHHHGHGHHHHGNENMYGIYLHILADTLGSVAVVISTILIHFYGWAGFDPVASVIIAVLIFASAVPLVKSSARTLLLTIPEDTEFDLREALAGVSALRGVSGYAVPKFWLEEGDDRRVLGVMHVFVAKGADMEDVRERAVNYLRTRGMNILVQVEREGSGRCWCRGASGLSPR